MPSLSPDTRLLGLYAGIIETPNFLFLQTGAQGQIDAFFQTASGTRPLFTLNGKVLYSNTGTPSGSVGSTGDFFISENLLRFYGPKQSGTGQPWPSSYANLSGAQGPSGAQGIQGIQGTNGTGIPGAGLTNQIIVKSSNTSYDTEWKYPFDVIREDRITKPSAFNEIYRNLNVRGTSSSAAPSSMGSSVTYRPSTNTLFCIDNATPSLNEYTIDGRFVRSISLSGFIDCEAIEWMYDDYFAIGQEYNTASGSKNEIDVVLIAETGPVTIIKWSTNHVRNIDLTSNQTSTTNLGIETVCYNPDLDVFYFVSEKAPSQGWAIFQVDNDSSVSGIADIIDLTSPLSANSITDISDGCFIRSRNSILLVSQESEKMIEFNLDGAVMEVTDAPSVFASLEGVAVTPDCRLMFLTGESNITPGPDLLVLESFKYGNPSNDSNHGLIYLKDGFTNSINAKTYELIDPYFTITNNTLQSISDDWTFGSRTLSSGMLQRGKRLSFNSYGIFVPSGATNEICSLNFTVRDTGNSVLCGDVTLTGIPTSGTGSWSFEGKTSFASSFYYYSAKVLYDNGTYSRTYLSNSSGNISSLATGIMNFKSKFNVTGVGTSGRLHVYAFSNNID